MPGFFLSATRKKWLTGLSITCYLTVHESSNSILKATMTRVEISEYLDFKHVEPTAHGQNRRVLLRVMDVGEVGPLSRVVCRILTPEDARRLAVMLIEAADKVDAVRITV